MRDDLISRQAAMDFISAIPFVENHPHLGCFIKEWISQVPAAQPEQRTGHWFDKESKVKESKVKCVLRLPCRNGEFAVDEDLLADLTHTYPDMDVRKSLEKLCSYLTSKPGKQGYVSSAEGYLRMWLADDDREGKYRKKQTDTYEETYDLELYESNSAIDELEDNEDDT